MAEVFFRPRALKGFKAALIQEKLKIKACIEILKKGDFPLHTKKLGSNNVGYRTRVGRWRVLFVLENNMIDVVDIVVKKGRDDYQRRT